MIVELLADPEAVAARGARLIADEARAAVAARGRFVLALSGGTTPGRMLARLVGEDLPWPGVHLLQVDERVAPPGHAERNWSQVEAALLAGRPLGPAQLHPMPVDQPDLDQAARDYAATLTATAGSPPVIDLVHLGLGADGHTASLVPGDPVLDVADAAVAPTGLYGGRRRLTLTFPTLDRARRILWLVTGPDKRQALARLRAGDATLPAGRVRRDAAIVLVDRAAAGHADPA